MDGYSPEDLDYAVGAVSIPGITPEIGVTQLTPNKTLYVGCFQDEGPYEPEVLPKTACKNISSVFEHLKPSVNVNLQTGKSDSPEEEINISLDSLKSFQLSSIKKSIPLLDELDQKQDVIGKFMNMISKSKKLQEVLNDPEKKDALLNLFLSIKEELNPEV